MYNHVMVGSSNIGRSRAFYDATFAALGGTSGVTDAKGRLIYRNAGGTFMVSPPIDGGPATGANGGTIGFKAETAAAADAWHKAGTEAGGVACEDPPGLRGSIYLAYLRDPDGNKLCVVHRPS